MRNDREKSTAVCDRTDLVISCLVFCVSFTLLFHLYGHRISLDIDEGIYLEGARRVVNGQVPYRDFFVLTGPGSFWLLAAVFQVFGVELSSARLLVAFDVAFITAGVYWLAVQSARRPYALLGALAFLSSLVALPTLLMVNHRWDSSMLATAALIAVAAGAKHQRQSLYIVAGLLAAGAAWTTPPMLLVAAAIGGYLVLRQPVPYSATWYLVGATMCSVLALCALLATGALVPFLQHMLWTAANYSSPNFLMYGTLIGGYGPLFQGLSTSSSIAMGFYVSFIALPVLVPVAVVGGAVLRRFQSWHEVLLLIAGIALLLSVAPRWDLVHLRRATPIFFALGAILASKVLRESVRTPLLLASMTASVLMMLFTLQRFGPTTEVLTAVGRIGFTERQQDLTRGFQYVRPGDRLFVYPYFPMAYFLWKAENPTRYSFFQAGMMTQTDERKILRSLEHSGPDWIFLFEAPIDWYLRNWPGTDLEKLKPNAIEEFIKTHYTTATVFQVEDSEFRLLKRAADKLGHSHPPPAGGDG